LRMPATVSGPGQAEARMSKFIAVKQGTRDVLVYEFRICPVARRVLHRLERFFKALSHASADQVRL